MKKGNKSKEVNKKGPVKIWNKKELSYIVKHYNKMSLKNLSSVLEVSVEQLRNAVKKLKKEGRLNWGVKTPVLNK